MEPAVILTSPSTPVEPGGVGIGEVRVRNTGSTVEEYTLELVGGPASWAVVEPALLRLFPGDEGTAVLRFQPPRDAAIAAGATSFGVRVTPSAEPQSAVVEEGTFTIGGFVAVSADISPRNVDGDNANHTVTVHNGGNEAVVVSLAYRDPDERTAGTLQPPELTVGGGEAGSSTLKVVAKGGRRKGGARHGYQVVVSPAGQTPLTLEASLTRKGKRRKAPLVAVAILLVVALIAFVALRPKVESAAVEIKQIKTQLVAAKAAVEQAQDKVAEAKKAADAVAGAAGQVTTTLPVGAGETTTTVGDTTTTTAAGGDGTTTSVAGGDPSAVTTTSTTQSPKVAAALTGEDAFGTVTPTATCIGGTSPSTRSGSSSSSTSSTPTSTTSGSTTTSA
jgi:hypothetical protein